ncbi:hypothetical protein [uncultured Piscinibacter sp.]|uniref:hypothetical protein n=1 Tax=uncultured Piscinibacter sp. TaxID=1131835 RepID=UPI00261ED4C9|nr:hypothetical protein [uncultured Piscinibacter sp.]
MCKPPLIRPSSLAAALLASVGPFQPALAQSPAPAQSLLDADVVLNVGAFVLSTDLNARLNGRSTVNPDVDFDETFGGDGNATRVRADALWRITRQHHLRLLYFDDTRTSSRVLDEQVQWGDYTFQVGGRTELQSRLTIGELAYEYGFIHRPGFELAGSLGIHLTKIHLGLSGEATVTDADGNVGQAALATTASDLSAPLPVIGLRAAWVVSPSWVVDAQGQFFKVRVNGYDGTVSDLRLGATWMYNRHFGVGAGYNRFSTKVDVSREAFNGRLRMGYSGLLVHLTGVF